MAKLQFDQKKIEQDAIKQAVETVKEDIKLEIEKIGQELGERPKVSFIHRTDTEFTVEVKEASEELDKRVQEYLNN